MTIRPRGQTHVFHCCACAVLSANRKDVLMGFEVYDSWLTTAAEPAAPHSEDSTQQSSSSGDENNSLTLNTMDRPVVEERRVNFDIQTESSDSDADPSRAPYRKTDKFTRKHSIACSCIRTVGQNDMIQFLWVDYAHKLRTTWTRRAKFCTAPVDLHSRGEAPNVQNLIVAEARVLLECRHPNILFMLGFALNYAEGPVLVMEQSWGSVMLP